MIILPITLTIAGAAAILHVWLSVRVSRLRRPLKIGVGDGGNEVLARRMRAHGNYAENMPILLILLGFTELATGGNLWLWGAAILFILARIAHAFGMDRAGANPLRVGGIAISWAVLLGLGVYAILLAYQSPPIRSGIQLSPGRSASLQI
ncbi:MAG TPA: MAPEG family protein [Allosphingosinicella sp.]|nr:MAPEG family protein [Allosphingosinicella sp.]